MKTAIKITLGTLIVAAALTATAHRQKTPIAVECSGKDTVGQSFCYEVKNALASSALFS